MIVEKNSNQNIIDKYLNYSNIKNNSNYKIIRKILKTKWAAEEFQFFGEKKWEETFCRETENFYETKKKYALKQIQKGNRKIIIDTIYDIVLNKISIFFNLHKTAINLNHSSYLKNLFKLVCDFPINRVSLKQFCKKLEIQSQGNDKTEYNAAIQLIGGDKRLNHLNQFACTNEEFLKKQCDEVLPSEKVLSAYKNFQRDPCIHVSKTFVWTDDNNSLSKVKREDVVRALFGDQSLDSTSLPVSLIPHRISLKNKPIFKKQVSNSSEFRNECLLKIFKAFDTLLFDAGEIEKKSKTIFLQKCVKDYLSNKNDILPMHGAYDYLTGFTLNAYYPAMNLLTEHFPQFFGHLLGDIEKLVSKQDKSLTTKFNISLNSENNICISQKKRYIITMLKDDERVLARYKIRWTLFRDKAKWKGILKIYNMRFSEETSTEVRELIFKALNKHDRKN